MSASAYQQQVVSDTDLVGSSGSEVRALLRAITQSTSGRIGLAIVTANLCLFILGPVLAPHDPTATLVGPIGQGSTSENWLGTDALGRDVFSRLLNGGGSVILPPFVAVLLAFFVGGTVGTLAGYVGGLPDQLVSRFLDVALAIPGILLALIAIAAFGTSTLVLVLTVAIIFAPRVAVVLRGSVRSVRNREFVLAAEARGEGSVGVVFREIVPNITGPMLVEFAIRLTYAVIFVVSLSVLGLGVQPPSPNWGLMISESRQVLIQAPIVGIAPALAIAQLLVGIILVTDAAATHFHREATQR